jgi:hypothetical protein
MFILHVGTERGNHRLSDGFLDFFSNIGALFRIDNLCIRQASLQQGSNTAIRQRIYERSASWTCRHLFRTTGAWISNRPRDNALRVSQDMLIYAQLFLYNSFQIMSLRGNLSRSQ